MDLIYHYCGGTAFKGDSRLAECWRDQHTVGQTVTLAPEWYPIGGRVYLGLDSGPPLAVKTRRRSFPQPVECTDWVQLWMRTPS
jgi:hypothetical protein